MRARRAGRAVGDWQRGRRTQSNRAVVGNAGGFRLARGRDSKTGHGTRPRFRDQLLARSSLRARAPRLVLQTPRWLDQICRESTEKIRRHLSVEFSLRKLARALG